MKGKYPLKKPQILDGLPSLQQQSATMTKSGKTKNA